MGFFTRMQCAGSDVLSMVPVTRHISASEHIMALRPVWCLCPREAPAVRQTPDICLWAKRAQADPLSSPTGSQQPQKSFAQCNSLPARPSTRGTPAALQASVPLCRRGSLRCSVSAQVRSRCQCRSWHLPELRHDSCSTCQDVSFLEDG